MQREADEAQQKPPASAQEHRSAASPRADLPKLLLPSQKIISPVQCLLNISIYFCFIKGEILNSGVTGEIWAVLPGFLINLAERGARATLEPWPR